MADIINEDGLKIPQHIAIILDGNGRWAKKRMLPRNAGHVQGARNVSNVCRAAYNMGVKYITMYAFSTENWKRPDSEVKALMSLLDKYLKECMKTCKKDNMVLKVIGDRSGLSESLQKQIKEVEDYSAAHTGLILTIAINYGSRDEICRAVNHILSDVKEGKLSSDTLVTEDLISSYLDTSGTPDPDLMIRTSGEQRLSNYLMWQLAYAELYFTDVFWPDFDKKDLEEAIRYYNTKERRFGGLK